MTEIGASKVGNFAPFSCPGRDWYHPATYELRCGAEALAALRHAEAHPGAWWISKPRAGSRGRVPTRASPGAADEACPRVAQRYVRDVALYRGRKFDVRFLVLVRRLEGDALCGRLWRDFWAESNSELGYPNQTSELSSSVTSKSIRLIFDESFALVEFSKHGRRVRSKPFDYIEVGLKI
ncbi:ATP binding protein [Aureococcus anophagefferens]|nr:ATP binding protein [Aureococcus anophagefferens]